MNPSLEEQNDYRAYLKEVLIIRRKNNPSYSLRAFARDLKINAPRLSEVINRKKGLSLSAAAKLSESLGHSPAETEIFCDLVQLADSRSNSAKKVAELRLLRVSHRSDYEPLRKDIFNLIADWYHYSILELTFVRGFQSKPSWIAKKLGIRELEAQEAIDRLLRLGLLEQKNGKLKKSAQQLTTTHDIPSTAIQKLNEQLLTKAIDAIAQQPVGDRDFSTITMAIDPKKIPRAKEMIRQFRRALCQELESGDQSKVYCFSAQLFRLSQE